MTDRKEPLLSFSSHLGWRIKAEMKNGYKLYLELLISLEKPAFRRLVYDSFGETGNLAEAQFQKHMLLFAAIARLLNAGVTKDELQGISNLCGGDLPQFIIGGAKLILTSAVDDIGEHWFVDDVDNPTSYLVWKEDVSCRVLSPEEMALEITYDNEHDPQDLFNRACARVALEDKTGVDITPVSGTSVDRGGVQGLPAEAVADAAEGDLDSGFKKFDPGSSGPYVDRRDPRSNSLENRRQHRAVTSWPLRTDLEPPID